MGIWIRWNREGSYNQGFVAYGRSVQEQVREVIQHIEPPKETLAIPQLENGNTVDEKMLANPAARDGSMYGCDIGLILEDI